MPEEHSSPPDHRLTRRQTLGIAGAAGSAVVLGGTAGKAISALADSDEVTAATAAKACKLTPEVTEGPFYVALDRIRRDITEGRPGVPLTLKIRVIDVKRCAPIHGAAVDIWHCDAGGLYSDESSNSSVYAVAPYSSATRRGRSTPRTASTRRRVEATPRSASREAHPQASSGGSRWASTPRQLRPRSENLSPS
jgi:protocatechuate 3,4-dioxygenase beta subunit